MRFRPGSVVPDADVAQRLGVVLARRESGWVLPPEEGDAQPRPDESADVARPMPPGDLDEADDAGPGLAERLPRALRTGRFDPGRRGAVALVVVALLAAVVAGGVVLRGRPQEVVVPAVVDVGAPPPDLAASPAAQVVVAVSGKVRTPGLVRLPLGSRVDDALKAAGGAVPGVSTDALNLARKLVDGEQVLVGIDPPPGSPAGAGAAAGVKPGLLDLNSAAVGDLDALPGIGPVLAQRIVDWRSEHDRFDSVEQLREVTGIGEAKYADLAPKVTV